AGNPVSFANTQINNTRVATATFTAGSPVTVSSLATSGGPFTAGSSTPALPASLNAGQTLTVPLTFGPTSAGSYTGALTASTSAGPFALSITATATTTALSAAPTSIDFGSVQVGRTGSSGVVLYNGSSNTLTIQAIQPPAAPFAATRPPNVGAPIAPNGSLSIGL